MIGDLGKRMFRSLGLRVRRYPPGILADIARTRDPAYYDPLLEPWRLPGEFIELYERARPYTLVSSDRAHVLFTLACQALTLEGEWWECGVYRGGTAMILADLIAAHATPGAPILLRLFDTFAGMPATDVGRDIHRPGQFADTSVEAVRARVGERRFVSFHRGLIPGTFAGHEGARLAIVHVDVDLYTSVRDCCEFVWPRLVPGGFMVFDDYGFPSCPGARAAVDEYFANQSACPLILQTGQAVVFRSRA